MSALLQNPAVGKTASSDAVQSLRRLLNQIAKLAPETNTESVPRVFLYLDEAAVLGIPDTSVASQPDPPEKKSRLDYFVSAFDVLHNDSLFAVQLSTQSNINDLAPSMQYARSARYRKVATRLHAPLTETPFDCFGDFELDPAVLSVDDPSDTVFMAMFGRPL